MTEKEEMRLNTRNDFQTVKPTAANGLIQDEEAKRLALEALLKQQQNRPYKRAVTHLATWNGKVVPL